MQARARDSPEVATLGNVAETSGVRPQSPRGIKSCTCALMTAYGSQIQSTWEVSLSVGQAMQDGGVAARRFSGRRTRRDAGGREHAALGCSFLQGAAPAPLEGALRWRAAWLRWR